MTYTNHSPERRPLALSARAGFTIVELMVAMIILAVGITAGMRAINASTHASAHARDATLAASLAQQIMSETLAASEVTVGEDSGDFGDAHPGYHYETLIEESPEATGLMQVSVVVLWPGSLQDRRMEISTLYMPPPVPSETEETATTGGTGTGTGQGG